MSSDLENESVLRTNRANRCESRVIPALHMRCFPAFLSHRAVLLFWNNRLRGLPKVRVAVPGPVGWWNGLPQAATRLFASISHGVSHDLTRLAAKSYPDPRLIGLLHHKGPQFIQFQHRRLCIVGIRLDERVAQGWQLLGFF